MKAASVLVIESTPLVAEIIETALLAEPEVSTVEHAIDAVDITTDLAGIDVVLIAASLQDGAAKKWVREISATHKRPRIIVYGLTESHNHILDFIEAGASGYVLKDDPFEKMIEAIRYATNDKAIASPDVVAALMDRLSELSGYFSQAGVQLGNELLTEREREILELIGKGFSNRKISEALYIGYGTVKNHVHNILDKLNVSNRKEAAACLTFLPESSAG